MKKLSASSSSDRSAARLIAWSAAAVYLVMSVIFFQERILLRDGANFTVGMLNQHGFYLPLHRYAAWVTQFLPVIGIKTGATLNIILLLYSINVALFYSAVIICLDRVYRNYRLMLGAAVFLWVLTYDTFYMPISELPIGIAFVFLWLAQWEHYLRSGKSAAALAVLAVISLHIVFSHPLVLAVLLFLWLAAALTTDLNSLPGSRALLKPIALLAALLFIKVLLTGSGMYGDWSKLGKLENFLLNYRGLFLNQEANFYFKTYLVTSHLNGLLVMTFLLTVLLIRREYRHIVLLAGCSGLFTGVYLVTHPEFHIRLNIEVYFLVVAFYLAWYMAYAAFSGAAGRRVVLAAAFALICVQAVRAARHHGFFVERNAVITDILDQMQEQQVDKAVIPFYKAPMRSILYIGASGNESLLLSRLQDAERTCTFIFVLDDTVDDTGLEELGAAAGRFLNNPWENVPLQSYDTDYFRLDPESPYRSFEPVYD